MTPQQRRADEYLRRYRAKRARGLRGALRDLDTAFRADPDAGRLLDHDPRFAASPAAAPVLAYRGQARLFRGQAEAGLRDLETAAALEPQGWILAWLGEAYRQAGRAGDAARCYDRALELDPRYDNAWSWRATLRLASGDHAGALSDLDRALKLRPTARARIERARVLRRLARHAEALDELERAVRLNPELTWGGTSADALETSLTEIRAAARSLPEDGRLAAWEGETLLRLKRPREALGALERARARAARFAWARAWKAQALLELGAPAAAIRTELRAALKGDEAYARAHWIEALLESREGAPARAAAALTRAIRRSPYTARLYLARAGASLRLGRKAAARRDLDRCLRLCPGYAEAVRLRRSVDGVSDEKLESLHEPSVVEGGIL